jgi:Ca2+-binding RTX toxin-like protein
MAHLNVEGDVAHGIGNTPGLPQTVFSEEANQGVIDAHSIEAITDSLALYDLFARLDPALNTATFAVPEITDILKAAASDPTKSLENALDAVRRILLGSDVKTTPSGSNANDRDQFYTNYYALVKPDPNSPANVAFSTLAGNAVLRTLVGESQINLQTLAQSTGPNGLAYRYALSELNPFALLGANYETLHNNLGQLERYEPTTRTGTLTDEWLIDRSAFLVNKIIASTADSEVNGRALILQAGPLLQHFEDRSTATPYHLYIGNSVSVVNLPPSSISQILFGGDRPDNLTGGDLFDKLYGGAGNDFLQGGKGDDDYLEGGYGDDIYNYRLGDGHDDILDIDGRGRILYTDSQQGTQTLLIGGRQLTEGGNLYQSSTDPTIQYRKETNGNLTVVVAGADAITLRAFLADETINAGAGIGPQVCPYLFSLTRALVSVRSTKHRQLARVTNMSVQDSRTRN